MADSSSSNRAKYESRNPLQRRLIARFQGQVVRQLASLGVRSILDVGCGEGYLARTLLDAFPGVAYTGVDVSEQALAEARHRCPEAAFERMGFDDLAGSPERYDLVVCSEVLEHLDVPGPALRTLCALTSGFVLLTVPWEPWFRLANLARGRYVATLGNHPEHVQQWTRRGFIREVDAFFTPCQVSVSFPWTIYLGRPRP